MAKRYNSLYDIELESPSDRAVMSPFLGKHQRVDSTRTQDTSKSSRSGSNCSDNGFVFQNDSPHKGQTTPTYHGRPPFMSRILFYIMSGKGRSNSSKSNPLHIIHTHHCNSYILESKSIGRRQQVTLEKVDFLREE